MNEEIRLSPDKVPDAEEALGRLREFVVLFQEWAESDSVSPVDTLWGALDVIQRAWEALTKAPFPGTEEIE